MEVLRKLCLWLTIIGGLNWGFVGAFDVNLLVFLFGYAPWLVATLEIIVGICSVYTAFEYYDK